MDRDAGKEEFEDATGMIQSPVSQQLEEEGDERSVGSSL